jgi:acetyl esterase/lipase
MVPLLAALLLVTAPAPFDDKPTIELWSGPLPEPRVQTAAPEQWERRAADGIGIRTNVSKPRLVVFEAPAAARTGAAAVVIPGGGFGRLADEHEGADACRWLNGLGVTAFLLIHRCPTDKHPEPNLGPAQDAQRAVQLVRAQAGKWNVDAKKVGVLGFSAGGQVALVAATNQPLVPAPEGESVSHKPDFLVLAYPYRIYDPKTKALRADVKVDAGLPPTFIAQCADDKASLPQGSTLLFLELVNRGVPAELHVYAAGGHGYGMRPRPNATGPTDWGSRAADWLRLRGLATPAK